MWLWSGLFFALAWGFSRSLVGFAKDFNPPPWDGIAKAVEQTEPIRAGLSLPFFGGAIAVAIGYLVAIVVGLFIMARGSAAPRYRTLRRAWSLHFFLSTPLSPCYKWLR